MICSTFPSAEASAEEGTFTVMELRMLAMYSAPLIELVVVVTGGVVVVVVVAGNSFEKSCFYLGSSA